eukprot:GEMP01067830.1.p1 GENE.GEMP01067830.1~~GEMP01067830.1.p1  ORF type:complete len:118 (+),score=21.44 GEMP01067830.1:237-590(+)
MCLMGLPIIEDELEEEDITEQGIPACPVEIYVESNQQADDSFGRGHMQDGGTSKQVAQAVIGGAAICSAGGTSKKKWTMAKKIEDVYILIAGWSYAVCTPHSKAKNQEAANSMSYLF